MDTIAKFAISGIAFLLTLAFGFWLSNSGKPYNGLLFNVHKLIALGAVVAAVVQFSKTLKSADDLALVIALLIVASLCVVALFVSGALMSAGKLDYGIMLTVHRIAPAVWVVAMVLVAYLLEKQL
jgi:hypothetical protein